MRRVLVLAYYFPPLGGVGAHRTVKFVKHLAAFGYEATVVTGPEDVGPDWAPYDAALEADVPDSARIVRIRSSAPSSTQTAKRLGRVLGRPTAFESWWRSEAVAVAREVVSDADVVYASMSPFATALVAADVAAVARCPWVADLRDPWALDEWTMYPTALHRWLDERRMRRALASAAAIVMNTREATRALVASFPELDAASDVTTIPNGWDRDDFPALEGRRDGALRIVFTGWSHADTGRRHRRQRVWRSLLGGSMRGLDPLARSHVPLVEALERLRRLDPELADDVELHVAGPAATGLSGNTPIPVTDYGYLPHDRAVALMRSADVLFLPMHGLPAGVRARTVPGKTYEYLAAGVPVVAAVPEGDAKDLLSRAENVRLCEPGDPVGIAEAFRDALRRGRSAQPAPPELLETFERQRLTGALAAVFDRILESAPS